MIASLIAAWGWLRRAVAWLGRQLWIVILGLGALLGIVTWWLLRERRQAAADLQDARDREAVARAMGRGEVVLDAERDGAVVRADAAARVDARVAAEVPAVEARIADAHVEAASADASHVAAGFDELARRRRR